MKKFLLMAVAALTSVATWAIEKPKLNWVPLETNTEYYLFNVETASFIVGANDWGTRASVTNSGYGLKVKVTENGSTYYLCNVTDNNRFDCDGSLNSWKDGQGRQGDGQWTISEAGDGTYNFFNTVASDKKWGVDLSLSNTRTIFNDNDLAYGNTWAFFTEAPSIEDLTNFKPAMRNYNAITTYQKLAESMSEEDKAAFDFSDIVAKYEAGDYSEDAWAELDSRFEALLKSKPVAGADYTKFFVVNPNFDGNIDGWTDTFNGNTAKNHGYQGANYANGDVRISGFMECWTWDPQLGNGSLYQEVANLPAGEYTMSADVIAVRQSGGVDKANYTGVYIFAESDVLFKSDACATDNNAPVHYSFTFNTTGGTTKIGLMTENTNCNWVAFDNVKLVCNGPLSINPYQEALKEQVKNAVADRGEEKAGVKAHADYVKAYTDAVAAAENDKQSDEYYKNAADALTNASNALDASVTLYATLPAVYNSTYEKIEGFCEDALDIWYDDDVVSQIGVNAKNGTLDESYDYAAKIAEVYATCVEAQKEYLKGDYAPVADVTLLASSEWEGMTGLVAEQYCPDGPGYPERYQAGAFTGDVMTQTLTGLKKGTYRVTMVGGASYTSGRGFEGATGQNHAYFFANDALQSLEVYDRAVIAAGTIETAELTCGVNEDGVLKFGIQNITTGANWFVINLVKIEYLSTDLPPVDVDMVIGENKWATFMAPFNVKVPAGVTAYTAADGAYGHIELTKVTTIPANTPVLLNGAASKNIVSGVSRAESLTYKNGCLVGTYGDLEITEGYVLQNQPEAQGIAFYAVSADNAKTVPANHAYAVVTYAGNDESNETEEVKVMTFAENATAIQALNALTAGKAEIYDLNGRQINKLQKGVNIVNGVKVLVK